MFLRWIDKTITLMDKKEIIIKVGEETQHIFFHKYNIDVILKNPLNVGSLTCKKSFLMILYPYLIMHFKQFKTSKYFFNICLENKHNERNRNYKEANVIFSTSSDLSRYTLKHVAEAIQYRFLTMEEENFTDVLQNVRLVILSTELDFINTLTSIETLQQLNKNGNKSFKSDECVICLTNPPNVLFCNCGHIAICTECDKVKSLNICPVCKTENTIKRNI